MLQKWWEQREPREKTILIFGGFFLAGFLLLKVIILPWFHYVDNLKSEVQSQENLLAWITSAEKKIKQSGKINERATVSKESLLATLSTSLEKQTIKPTQIQQDNRGNVTIKLENIPFNQLSQWLHHVLTHYDVQLQKLQAKQTEIPGIVNADLVISP